MRGRPLRVVSGLAASAVLLAGCASGPSRAAVVERVELELRATWPFAPAEGEERDSWHELVEGIADAAIAGDCGSNAFRTGLDPAIVQAFDATCLMYFEGDMTEAERERIARSAP